MIFLPASLCRKFVRQHTHPTKSGGVSAAHETTSNLPQARPRANDQPEKFQMEGCDRPNNVIALIAMWMAEASYEITGPWAVQRETSV